MKKDLTEIREIFRRDKNDIIKKYSGTGAGIGKENNEYVIVVYMNKRNFKNPSEEALWKNIPVKLEYTGNFRTL